MSDYDYEPAENAAAKDVVMDALEAELYKQGVEVYTDDDNNEGGIDLINLSDAVVESLLKVGVTIPEDLKSPFSTR